MKPQVPAPSTASTASTPSTPSVASAARAPAAPAAPVAPAGSAASAAAAAPEAADAQAPPANPCLRCGACCASFRVDFARAEWAGAGGPVPEGLAEPITEGLCRLRGTDHVRPRCAALTGRVGETVRCAIHEWRPSPCREFGLRAPLGIGDEACDRARRRHGLAPLPG